MKKYLGLFIALFALFPSVTGWGGNPKNQYNLLNPTPKDQMRDMTMDRPDTIETPNTVDAGHYQVEVSLFSYTYDARTPAGGTVTNNFAILPFLAKAGLFNWLDFELGLEPYLHNQTRDITTSTATQANGFGDTTLRLKANLYGNDDSKVAVAALPFLKIPTNQGGVGNEAYEGGLLLPVEFDVADGWSVAGQTQYNIVQKSTGVGHTSEFINIAAVAHDFTEKLTVFGEVFTQISHETGVPWVGRFDTGFTYAVTPNFVLDGAVNIGLTESADDVNPFVGFSARY